MAHTQPDRDWNLPFTLTFPLSDGRSPDHASTKRHLSDMRGVYADEAAFAALTASEDPLAYEFYELGAPADAGDIAFGTSITYPGRVGDEYFMTKGHYHTVLATAEVYWCIRGRGLLLLENPEGDWNLQELVPGRAAYVPKRFAHRSINIGTEPFTTFFAFRADAGHDYGTIATCGFRKRVVDRDGVPVAVDNPTWRRNG